MFTTPLTAARALPAMILITLMSACAAGPGAPGAKGGSDPDAASGSGPSSPRGHLKIAWDLEPEALNPKMTTGSGVGEFMWLFNSFLTYYDFQGTSHPMLAERIPTRENGDWVVNADGTMVTTYRLRPNARWQDGRPVTAHDVVFAHEVYSDREIPVIHREPEPLMAGIRADDDQMLVIAWKQPYLRANQLGYRELNPIPRHVFEEKYRANKATFPSIDEWTVGYVGSGPFRVDHWIPGVSLTARAFDDWVLGTPKLESIEIRFISDPSTLLANLMAGEVDMISSPGVRASEAAIARDQWVARGQGYLRQWETRLSFFEFQYREVANWQRALTDVRVRQALILSVDRPGLVDAVNEGLGSPGDAFVVPSDPLFPDIDRAIAKYPYDPNRAVRNLEEAGWRRTAAGPVANAAGAPLEVEMMSGAGQGKAATIIGDNWKAAGITSVLNILAPLRERDREYRANFTGTQINGRSVSLENFHFVSGQIPRAETGFVELNRGSFYDAEVERMHTTAMTSFNSDERRTAIVGFQTRMSQLAAYAPLYYSVEVILAKHKVKGPIGNYGPQIGTTWNVYEWEVTE